MGSEGTSGGSAALKKSWAWKAALVLAAFGAAALLYVLFAAATKPDAKGGYEAYAVGGMAKLRVEPEAPPQPVETLRGADGAETTLAAYRGKVVLVNLWATWCAPCREEMPTLAGLQRYFAGQDFAVIPISIDDEAAIGEAQAMLAELSGGDLPFFVDISRGVAFSAKAPGLPTTILYDREGNELARLAGGAKWDSEEAVRLINAALEGAP